MSAMLQASGLTKEFKGFVAVNNVDLTVERGTIHALIGPNGAGKTTTFYIITGLISPDYGDIALDGDLITQLPMYRRARLGIGYLPQEASIFRGLSVEDNIRAILEVSVPAAHKRRRRLEELLGEFSIEHLRRAPALALSGGERRRVEIARCLASAPSFSAARAWLAPLPPGCRARVAPVTVSPGAGRLGADATMSRLIDPTTVILIGQLPACR